MVASSAFRSRKNCPAIPHILRLWQFTSARMTKLRSLREIAVRLRQELKNVYAFASPPKFQFDPKFVPRLSLPRPSEIIAALQGSVFKRDVLELSEQIHHHHFPILGLT